MQISKTRRSRAMFVLKRIYRAPLIACIAAVIVGIGDVGAVPSYARQTGQECIACHVSFPELTPYGRYFKLTGYTIGKAAITTEGVNYLPGAVMAQASITNTRNNHETDPETGET